MINRSFTITSNTSTTAFDWPGGSADFSVEGTFDGATVKLQRSTDGGTDFVDVGLDTTLTANGGGIASLGPCKVRINSASGGGSLNVVATIAAIAGRASSDAYT